MEEFNPEKLFERIQKVELLKKLPEKYIHTKVILGIDIYKYSQYPLIEQTYIPVLFDSLYESSALTAIEDEPFIFRPYAKKIEDFEKNFISTGDGGFQIFDNPVQAILFALCFQLNLKRFISGSSTIEFRQKLHKIIDTIDLRYAITSDLIYCYKSNFYGPGIINNARILSKDSLNRLLVDANTMKWFINNINSVENLMHIDKSSFTKTQYFKDYDTNLGSIIFNTEGNFKSVDSLKIGSIISKNTLLDIYNLHIQALVQMQIEKQEYDRFVITLGNLNTAGIE